ncbi:hypothetical protein TEK04_19855 [Klenkia sp. LSe6-5]|uniref:DUF1828 domain-containing protein n=1 Tax=Klenkia sesuvii TaxID=3103137 RepID=A0ABU8DZ75_9ACTN
MSIDADIDLVATFADTVRGSASQVSYGSGHLLTLPWSLHNGESIAILVEPLADGIFRLSDRGLAADTLAMADLNLASGKVAERWAHVKRSIDIRPSALPPVDAFELSGDAHVSELGEALTALAEAIMRADALHVFAKPARQLTFDQRVVQAVLAADVPVTTQAPLPHKFGGHRKVTCRLEPENRSRIYLQAVATGSDENSAYDHVRSLFADAEVDPDQLVAVVREGWGEKWQRSALAEVSTVIDDRSLPSRLAELAA